MPTYGTRVFDRNLLALSSRNPELSARLSAESGSDSLRIMRTKSSHLVPAQEFQGRLVSFHSRFDPVKEGQRYLDTSSNAGFVVFLGLGGGYHIEPFLEANRIMNILIIEKNLSMVRSILESIDMRVILMDHRVKLLVDADSDTVTQTVLEEYRPALAGNLGTVNLQARILTEKAYFQEIVEALKSAVGKLADDYTVQSQF